MPRLGSRFFDSYNGQIDRLRRRRGENVEAFNSFVKMREEMGETASVEEMEKFRNALGGGEQYFMSALPTRAMLQETNKALVANQADKAETRRQNAIKTSNDELALVTSIAGTVIDQDFNDTTEGGGRSKIAKAFETSGNGQLFKEYSDMMPNIMDTARTQATQQWVLANGYDKIETQEGKEALMALAPAWMKNTLETQGNSLVKRANDRKISQAINEVQGDMADIINDAGGDLAAVEKAVKARLRQKLGPLYSDEIFATMQEIAEGEVSLDLTKRTGDALANIKVDDELLVGAAGNEAALEDLAKQALIRAGLPNPTPTDIANAVAQLKQQQKGALRQDFETRLENAANRAEAMSSEEAKLIDGDREIDETVERILSGVFPNYENMSPEDKAEAVARVRAIIANKSALSNEAEQLADDEFVVSALASDPVLKDLYKMGPVADKMDTIYDQINLIRNSRGLPSMERADLEKQYGAYVNAQMKLGASQRYAAEVSTATKNADEAWNAITSNHQSEMERVADTLGDADDGWKMVVNIAETRWMPRSQTDYNAFQDVLLSMIEKNPPTTPQEAAALADKIAMSLNWLPAGTGRQQMLAEALAAKDLIRPGTPAGELVKDETGMLDATLLPLISQIQLSPMDGDPTAKKNAMLEAIDEWEQALISDLSSPAIKPLLNDMANVQAHIQAIRKAANKARTEVNNATPEGQYSFMIYSQSAQGGVFIVSDQPQDRQKVIDNGFKPGATYKKDADGNYVEILGAPVTVDGNPAPNQLSEVDPNATPFTQDLQSIMRTSDLASATDQVASRISSGGFSDQDLPASAPLFRSGIYQYFFGSNTPNAQTRLKVSQDLAAFLRSPEAKQYLQSNPDTYQSLFADPLSWAVNAGFTGV